MSIFKMEMVLLFTLLFIFQNAYGIEVNLLKCRNFEDYRDGKRSGNNFITIPEMLSSQWSTGDLTFGLIEGKISCRGNHIDVSVNIRNVLRQTPESWARSFIEVSEASKALPIHFTPTGHFYDGNFFHAPSGYCVQSISKEQFVLRTCTPICEGSTVCIPKCCGLDEALDFWSTTCVKINKTDGSQRVWEPEVYEEVWWSRTPQKISGIKAELYLSKEFPHDCNIPPEKGNSTSEETFPPFLKDYKSKAVSNPPVGLEHLQENHHLHLGIDSDGNLRPMVLYWEKRRIAFWREKVTFCADAFVTKDKAMNEIKSDQFMIFYCTLDNWNGDNLDTERLALISWIYIWTSLVSLPFIFATVGMYLFLFNKLNLHSLTILSYSIAELGVCTLLILPHLAYLFPGGLLRTGNATERGGWLCYLLGISAHFFTFASCMWLTVMNFDLWTTFREMKVARQELGKWKKLIVYSIVAWGIPLLMIGVFMGLDKVYRDPATLVVVPEYAASTCFVSPEAQGYYVFLPLTIILGVNILLVCLTLEIFIKARWNAKKTLGAVGGRSANRYSAKLFTKLFIMMGGIYIINYISWYYSYVGGNKPYWVVFLECLINFVPIVLFILFCLNATILRQLQEKFPSLQNGLNRVQKIFKIQSGPSSASTADTEVDMSGKQVKRENVSET